MGSYNQQYQLSIQGITSP